MKYISIAGIGLSVWGLFQFDWFKVGFGVFLIVVGFLIDLYKKKGAIKDDEVFSSYRVLYELIRIVKSSVDASEIDSSSSKAKLAQGLFYLGIVDAASQSARMDDEQFLGLFKAIFTDLNYDYDEEYQSRLLLFCQSMDTGHAGFAAIMKGGDMFVNFANGNSMAPLAGGGEVQKLIEDPSFPTSVEDL